MEALMIIGGLGALALAVWLMQKFHRYVERKYNFSVFAFSTPAAILLLSTIGFLVALIMYKFGYTVHHDDSTLLNIEVVTVASAILLIGYLIYVAKKTAWYIAPVIMLMQMIVVAGFFLFILAAVAGGGNDRKEVVVKHEYD